MAVRLCCRPRVSESSLQPPRSRSTPPCLSSPLGGQALYSTSPSRRPSSLAASVRRSLPGSRRWRYGRWHRGLLTISYQRRTARQTSRGKRWHRHWASWPQFARSDVERKRRQRQRRRQQQAAVVAVPAAVVAVVAAAGALQQSRGRMISKRLESFHSRRRRDSPRRRSERLSSMLL